MYITKKQRQLFSLTPVIIMLASSLFMFIYSVWGMLDINTMMLDASKEQEYISKIHSSIYTGLTKRSKALFKLVNSPEQSSSLQQYLNTIKEERNKLKENQHLCIHNKVKPIDEHFVKQGRMLNEYYSLEQQAIDLVMQNKKKEAYTLFSTQLLEQREATLNQIIAGNSFIRKEAQKKISSITHKIYSGIITFSLLNLVLIGFSLYFSVRLLKNYISDNKELIDSTKLDLLTNLSNRHHLLAEINEQITKHPHSFLAVAFIDIDYFKSVNDRYGHALADKLLIEFSRKLSSQLVNVDHCLSRFGGDEFVLLVKNMDKHKIKKLMDNISNVVNSNYYPQDDKEIWLSSSIGVSLYPDDATSMEMLLHNSDLAMYQAKQDGRGCYRLFSNELKNIVQAENDISQNLQTSLSKKENLYLLYQPLLNTQDCQVSECEALLRWDDPKLGSIPPDTFIAVAEKTNLIRMVNYFVIDAACEQQAQWNKEGGNPIRININLSGNQEIFTASLKRLMDHIERLNLSPSLFGIEITERSLFEINNNTITQLQYIYQKGVKISIDDFGTGYSSLLYLSKLPLTTLKIDKEFVSNICNKEKDNAIILSIIKLGQSLNLEIVAEGVETKNQCNYLKQNACKVIQGYLFSKPIKANKLKKLGLVSYENELQHLTA